MNFNLMKNANAQFLIFQFTFAEIRMIRLKNLHVMNMIVLKLFECESRSARMKSIARIWNEISDVNIDCSES
jgi:hypothetical protein